MQTRVLPVFCPLLTVFVLLMLGSPTLSQDKSQLREKVRGSIVHIETVLMNRDGTNRRVLGSTGFLISERGHALTVAHAVPRAGPDEVAQYKASVASRHAPKFPIEIIRRDEDLDVALFMCPKVQTWKAVDEGDSGNVPEDAKLYVLGFPQASDLASAEGLLSSHYGPGGKWQTTLPLNYGNSGGPVFDIGGRVIGIAAGGYDHAQSVTYAIPYNYARPLRSLVQLDTPTVPEPAAPKTFQFAFTVDHQEQRSFQQEFCLESSDRVMSVIPKITSVNGDNTRLLSATVNPSKPNCATINVFVAGKGVDRVGPIVVNHRGRGWLAGQVELSAQQR
jgi:hypothetical protein